MTVTMSECTAMSTTTSNQLNHCEATLKLSRGYIMQIEPSKPSNPAAEVFLLDISQLFTGALFHKSSHSDMLNKIFLP